MLSITNFTIIDLDLPLVLSVFLIYIYIYKNFMAPFYGWGSTASRLEPLWPLSSQKFLVLIVLNLEGWKAESTLEPPSGFEHRTLDWESSTVTTRPLLHWYWFTSSGLDLSFWSTAVKIYPFATLYWVNKDEKM